MDQQTKTPVLLITGTIGVGKSSVADEVFEILKEQLLPVALINLDEFGYAYPHPNDDPLNFRLRLKNLASVWINYKEAGVSGLIIPFVIKDQAQLDHFHQAIPGAQLFVVRLDAPLAVLEERIRNRPMGAQ